MNARLTIVISLFISIYTKQIKLLENLIYVFLSAFPFIENKKAEEKSFPPDAS
jgi:hypothetical protein